VTSDKVHNVFSGVSSGLVIQARDVHLAEAGPHPVPRQLPPDPAKFTGRREHLRALAELVTDDEESPTGVAVIVGQPGVGKTALAVHWAHQVLDRFPDGQLYVDLRGYATGTPVDWEDVLEDFLMALGGPKTVVPTNVDARTGLYRSLLSGRRVLVVLDNALSAEQVRPLIPGESGCFVLVTSRSGLPGLVAREGAQRLRLDVLPIDEAVEFLTKVIPGDVPVTTSRRLAELCGRLPLALRIVAEHAANPAVQIDDLIAAADDERTSLDSVTVVEEDAQTAVRTVFFWSYRALPPAAADMFRLLGLWPGSNIGADAAAALAGITVSAARRALLQLANANLVDGDAGWFRIHDLLGEYAKEMAEEECQVDEGEQAVERLLYWYVATMDNAEAAINRNYPPLNLEERGGVSPLEFRDSDAAITWQMVEHVNVLAVVRGATKARFYTMRMLLALLIQFANTRHLESAFKEIRAANEGCIAAKDEIIASLKESIDSLRGRVEAKDCTIRAQEATIAALEETVKTTRESIAIQREVIEVQDRTIRALRDPV